MRLRTLALCFPGLCVVLSGAAHAGHAGSATGHATAVIVQPLHVRAKSPLDFGVVLPSSHDGEVKITPQARRQVTGRVRMASGDYEPARFDITGAPFFYYVVHTPQTLMFRTSHGYDDDERWHRRYDRVTGLQVKDFTTFSQNLGAGGHRGYLGTKGRDRLSIGATLIVPTGAAPGRYRGFVPISVDYQ